jgi:hypothetical protein
MIESDAAAPAEDVAARLLAASGVAERKLLKDERKSEKRLTAAQATVAADEARLARAQRRLDRSRQVAAAAAEELRQAQARRAAGPSLPPD